MIISNKNKRSQGRPSLRTMTVRKGLKHATIVFARKAGADLMLQPGNKVSIIENNGMYYLCPNAEEGANIKVARNGQGLESYRISKLEYVTMLLNAFGADGIAVLLIGSTTKEINGEIYYQIVKKAIRVDKW